MRVDCSNGVWVSVFEQWTQGDQIPEEHLARVILDLLLRLT